MTNKAHKRSFLARLFVRLLLGIVLLGGAYVGYLSLSLPSLSQLQAGARRPKIVLLDRFDVPFLTIGDTQFEPVTSKDVPPLLIKMLVLTEDHRFWDHPGLDWQGIVRSAWVNVRARRIVQGGSTLTQQLAKTLFLSSERTFSRKIQESMLALWLEHHFAKAQLLTIYLNRVYMAPGVYGFPAAAAYYFHKPLAHLTPSEMAYLVGLLKAPATYSPRLNPDRARKRAQLILNNMVAHRLLQKNQATLGTPPAAGTAARQNLFYFADWVIEEVRRNTGPIEEDIVIYTTLDRALYERSQHMLKKHGPDLKKAGAEQLALVALGGDGAVRLMVGGKDYLASPFNRAVYAQRQLGSLFKFLVHLAALEDGWTKETLLEDRPLTISGWRPQNIDRKYVGDISLEQSFVLSRNVPTVWLAQRVGLDKIIQVARRLGFTQEIPHNLTIALGSVNASLLEITNIYDVIRLGGALGHPYGVRRIQTPQGEILHTHTAQECPTVLSSEMVQLMRTLMSGVIHTGTGRAANHALALGGKTGTTQDNHDAWFVGYTPEITLGVWLGTDGHASLRTTGGGLPTKIWHTITNS